jgi:tRNA threonylcarbamoyladenosine biosynthesis protein TsaB
MRGKSPLIILGLDSSAVASSCAVVDTAPETERIIASAAVNVKITHSQTLLPLVENMFKTAGMSLSDADAFAVTAGPGSFTGLRIAVSAVKGMAFALNKPVCGVSTLLSLAYNLLGQEVTACPVMDARRGEVYNALFDISGGKVTRLTPDRAISLEDLKKELQERDFTDKKIMLLGDGAHLAHDFFGGKYKIAPEIIRWQSAASTCFASLDNTHSFLSAEKIMPIYIRKPQAERELASKRG